MVEFDQDQQAGGLSVAFVLRLLTIVTTLIFALAFWRSINSDVLLLDISELFGIDASRIDLLYIYNFLLLVFIATVFFHLMFRKVIFSNTPRSVSAALIKSIDYVWYTSAIGFAALIVSDIQLNQQLLWRDVFTDTGTSNSALGERLLSSIRDDCAALQQPIAAETLAIRQEAFLVEEFCSEALAAPSFDEITCNPPSEWIFRNWHLPYQESIPELGLEPSAAEAHFNIASLCVLSNSRLLGDAQESSVADRIRELSGVPSRNRDLFVSLLFAFVLGLRLSKVTFDVVQALKKSNPKN